MQFFLPMNPPRTTKQTQRMGKAGGKLIFYDTPELRAAEQKLIAAFAQHSPPEPLTGPVRLVVKWIWHSKDKHRHGQYKPTRPDTDNLQKLLKDVMGKVGFYHDDAQVASEIAEKFWGAQPGIFVQVEQL
jgi:Holliday junction resolvase RusA-like endonuclease